MFARDVGDAAQMVGGFPDGFAAGRPITLAAVGTGLRQQACWQVICKAFETGGGTADVVADLCQPEAFYNVRLSGIAAAEHQRAVLRNVSLHLFKQIAVEGDLHHVFGFGVVRQFGVPGFVGPLPALRGLIDAHEIVGVADPVAISQGRLRDEPRAFIHRPVGLGHPAFQRAGGDLHRRSMITGERGRATRFVLVSLALNQLGLRIGRAHHRFTRAAPMLQRPGGGCGAAEKSCQKRG